MAEFNAEENFEKLNKATAALHEEMKSKLPDPVKLAKMNEDISGLDAKHNVHVAAIKAREDEAKTLKGQLDEVEKKLNRIEAGAGGNGAKPNPEAEAKAAWNAFLRFGQPGSTVGAEEKWTAEAKRLGVNLERKALTISDDTTGGYLSGPADYVKQIIKAIVLISPMRTVCNVRTTSMRNVQIPKRTGTAAAVWIAEQGTRSESQNPSYGLVDCPTHELTAEIYISMQDLEDSAFDLEAEMNNEFAEQFAFSEGNAVVVGDGKTKPWGFANGTVANGVNAQGVAVTNSGSAATIQDVNGQANGLIKMVHNLKSGYAANGQMLLNRQTLGSVRSLQDSQKRYLWQVAISADMPSTILGFPYVETPDMPSEAAGATPIAVGDFKRAYTIVDRLSIAVMRDPFTKASQGQVKFMARRRVGGQVVLAEAIQLLTCHT